MHAKLNAILNGRITWHYRRIAHAAPPWPSSIIHYVVNTFLYQFSLRVVLGLYNEINQPINQGFNSGLYTAARQSKMTIGPTQTIHRLAKW